MLPQILYKNWDALPFSVYKELQEIRNTEWESNIQRIIEECALFLDIAPDDELFDTLEVEELYAIRDQIIWHSTTPPSSVKSEITCNGVALKLLDPNQISFGAFIDLEHFTRTEPDNLLLFNAILYRQWKQDEWCNLVFEPYKYDIRSRAKWFEQTPVPHLYGAFMQYADWKKKIISTYTGVFEDPDWDKIDNEEELPPEEIVEIKKEIEIEKKKAPHSWTGIILNLCDGNIASINEILDLPAILVFNILSTKKALKI